MTSIKLIGINWLFVFLITLSASATTGLAQIPEPQPIAQSVPDKWRGPFRIREILENSTFYRLEELDGTLLTVSFAGNRLKRFFT